MNCRRARQTKQDGIAVSFLVKVEAKAWLEIKALKFQKFTSSESYNNSKFYVSDNIVQKSIKQTWKEPQGK